MDSTFCFYVWSLFLLENWKMCARSMKNINLRFTSADRNLAAGKMYFVFRMTKFIVFLSITSKLCFNLLQIIIFIMFHFFVDFFFKQSKLRAATFFPQPKKSHKLWNAHHLITVYMCSMCSAFWKPSLFLKQTITNLSIYVGTVKSNKNGFFRLHASVSLMEHHHQRAFNTLLYIYI